MSESWNYFSGSEDPWKGRERSKSHGSDHVTIKKKAKIIIAYIIEYIGIPEMPFYILLIYHIP